MRRLALSSGGPGGPAPCVVLGSGLSCVRDQGLDLYSERFAAAGIAALAFDYRFFGDSEGEPRTLLSARMQREDFRAAIAFARTVAGIDRARIAIWGFSYGSAHAQESRSPTRASRRRSSSLP